MNYQSLSSENLDRLSVFSASDIALDGNQREPDLTILTASWNRAHLLPRLYQSIVENHPASTVVEWWIIDDGSTDKTKDVIAQFQPVSGLSVRYLHIEHGGKHRALNAGFGLAAAPWVMIVDSDDWFLDGGISRCLTEIGRAEAQGAKAIFLPMYVADSERQWVFEKPRRSVPFFDRVNQEPWFDSSFVFSKEVCQSRFPEIVNETFLTERAFLARLGTDVTFFLSDQVCVQVEYQADGLSLNSLPTRMASPVGSTLTYQIMLEGQLRPKIYLRALANFGRFWWHSIFKRSRVALPKTLPQYAVLPAGLALALVDHFRRHSRRR